MKKIKIVFKENQYISVIDDVLEDALKNNIQIRHTFVSNLIDNKSITETLDDYENIIFLKENQHFCKYCGEVADGPDDNILCDDCAYTFGHRLYSEL